MGSQSATPEMFMNCSERPSCWLGGQAGCQGRLKLCRGGSELHSWGQQGPSSHPCPAGEHKPPPEI